MAETTPQRIGGRCAICGMPGHRYGSNDPVRVPDKTACVNGLLTEIERYRTHLRNISDLLEDGNRAEAMYAAYRALARERPDG